MLVATAQIEMRWTVEENLETILATNEYAGASGAQMVLYPELAMTGYHRQILEERDKFRDGNRWIDAVCVSCADLSLYVWIGHPQFLGDAAFNSYSLIDPEGKVALQVYKNGLTKTEEIAFSSGTERPTIDVHGYRMTALMCREVADLETASTDLKPNGVDLVVWPGCIAHRDTESKVKEGTRDQAASVAQALSCQIVQCNWANSVNKPERNDLGGSVLLDRAGRTLWRCPEGAPGIGFMELGAGAAHYWDATHF